MKGVEMNIYNTIIALDLSPATKIVLLHLVLNSDVSMSSPAMSKLLKLTKTTVLTSIKLLEELGYIAVKRQAIKVNKYSVNYSKLDEKL